MWRAKEIQAGRLDHLTTGGKSARTLGMRKPAAFQPSPQVLIMAAQEMGKPAPTFKPPFQPKTDLGFAPDVDVDAARRIWEELGLDN